GTTRMSLRTFELLVISLVMQLSLALPMAWYFHRATTLSLAANILAVPLAGIVLPAAIIALLFSVIAPPLAPVPAKIAAGALHLIASSSTTLGRTAEIRTPNPLPLFALAAALAFVVAAIGVRVRPAVALAGIAALALAAALPVFAPAHLQVHPGALEITAIDVGQGDSLLVISPEGRTLLIDSGGHLGPTHSDFDFGEDVVSPYLWSRGIRRLDAIALTHVHQDHLGGMLSVLRNFRPRQLWLGIDPPTAPLNQLLAAAQQSGVRIVQHIAGDTIVFGGATLRVLAPPRDWQPRMRQANNDSLV